MQEAFQNTGTSLGLTATFMEYRPRLEAFMGSRCRGASEKADLEDAMQELWLRCRTVDVAGIVDLKSYVFRMAHNIMIDRRRQIERLKRYDADWSYVNDDAENSLIERSLIAREKLELLDRALRKAGERAVWIFHRHRLEGRPQYEIASELGVSLSTVEKDIRKAYDALSRFRGKTDEE